MARLRKLGALVAGAAAIALLASAAPAAAITPVSCPSFRILHNDRIGPAALPAGTYMVTLAPTSGLTCATASKQLTRFLEDYDGNLPAPWRVVAEGGGEATFNQGGKAGFSVTRSSGEEGGGRNTLGRLCRGTFTVISGATVGPLSFPKGPYLLYIPPRSGIACNRASALFTRFLGAGFLPSPWRLGTQTATFFKPAQPTRSAFRVEPLAGAGPA